MDRLHGQRISNPPQSSTLPTSHKAGLSRLPVDFHDAAPLIRSLLALAAYRRAPMAAGRDLCRIAAHHAARLMAIRRLLPMKKLWRGRDSNPRPSAYEANVLTNCTTPPYMAGITHRPRRPRRKLLRLTASARPHSHNGIPSRCSTFRWLVVSPCRTAHDNLLRSMTVHSAAIPSEIPVSVGCSGIEPETVAVAPWDLHGELSRRRPAHPSPPRLAAHLKGEVARQRRRGSNPSPESGSAHRQPCPSCRDQRSPSWPSLGCWPSTYRRCA